ncbi:MAG: metal-dependent transcriptional regulator [Planctomycetes bacterium]|nr:metal-dependent transcriptional regulator [Planctomycetota bacterium]
MTTSTVEDYLKCIYQAEQRSSGLISTGQIASALQVAPGTATAMMKTLADSGLITYEPYNGVRLTGAGSKLAAHVLRRHRVVELFLVEVMGMSWSEVHGDAEILEHAVSDRLLDRMDDMLGKPSVDPHGDPIPSPRGVLREKEYPTLLTCPLRASLRVARVTDQSAEFLKLLERHGVMPGNAIEVESREEAADTVTVKPSGGKAFTLGCRAAGAVQVEPNSGKQA